MANHVASLCRSWFFQLRQLRLVRPSLTSEAAKTPEHTFVSSSLDYCNYLLYGVTDGLPKKLQAVQNSAARVVTGTRKFDHITPVFRYLHWQRILFKLATIVFKCLHGLAPSYLADDCVLTSAAAGRRRLRSADTTKLLVRRTRTVIGAIDFAVSAAAIWNSLPGA